MRRTAKLLLIALILVALVAATVTPLKYIPFYAHVGYGIWEPEGQPHFHVLEKRVPWFPGPDMMVVQTVFRIDDPSIFRYVVNDLPFGSLGPMLTRINPDSRSGDSSALPWMTPIHLAKWWGLAP